MGRKKGGGGGSGEIELLDNPTIVAIDPGGTTGWSVMSVHPEALAGDASILLNIEHWSHGEITGDENSATSEVLGIIDSWPGCVVLIEDFILRSSVTSREILSPVRIGAKIEFGLFLTGRTWHRQMPSEAKTSITDDRLKSWGFYQREGGLEHARDADRHSLRWLQKCKQHPWMRAACWPYLFGTEGEYASSVAGTGADDDEELG